MEEKKNKSKHTNINKYQIQGKTPLYLRMPVYLCLILLPAEVWLCIKDIVPGGILGTVTIVYFILTYIIYCYSKKRYLQEMVEFATDYTQVQKRLIKDLELPYGLLDKTGRILWTNKSLAEIMPDTGFKPIFSVFDNIQEDVLDFTGQDGEKKVEIHYNNHYYKSEFSRISVDESFSGTHSVIDGETAEKYDDAGGEYLIAMYLFDETEIKRLLKENSEQKMVAGLIYLDNYDDALQSVEDVRRSLLIALIDRKINKYMFLCCRVISFPYWTK